MPANKRISTSHRQLRVERCESRRLLSANQFATDEVALQTQDDYVLTASSGWTPIDVSTNLVAVASRRPDAESFGTAGAWDDSTTNRFILDSAIIGQIVPRFGTAESIPDRNFAEGAFDSDGSFSWNGWTDLNLDLGFADFDSDRPVGQVAPSTRPGDLDSGGPSSPRALSDRDPSDSAEPTTRIDAELPRLPLTRHQPIRRLDNDVAPAGTEQPGAGRIDLALLLEPATSSPTSSPTAQVGAIASATEPLSAQPSRDAAFAVESWVRSVPTTAAVEPATLPDQTLRADEQAVPKREQPTESSRDARKPTTAQTEQSIQSDESVRVEGEPLAGYESPHAVPGVLERTSTYRLAVAAFSTLLGGGLVWGTRRAVVKSEPDCVERPRPRKV